ncbi:MAG TPA: ATP-binding protein [Gallionella sp.]|nr:ATP-binding protein [Gallionella sp.]
MRFLPRTLLGRAFLLIVVLIALSFAASAAIFRHAVQEPRVQQMAELVVSAVNLTRAAVLSSAPEWRGALLEELRDAEGLRVQLADAADVLEPMPEHPSELRLMMDEVRNRLGNGTRFASVRNGEEGLWVSFRIGEDEFWLSLPRERIDHPLSQVLLVLGSMVLLLALVGAYFIARQVAWPLKRLEHAAHQVGEGEMPLPLPERGAQEIATVSHAFNQMSADLAANERERALVLAGISHDLRTPLARVRLAAELTADASLREGLVADVEQMDAVIRQFLDYARLDESEAAEPIDLPALVRDAAQSFASQAESIDLDLQPLEPLTVRPLLLKRARANLLENAIKYGGGEITVRLQRKDRAVELSVADRGKGIPDAQREAAKRPFVRLQAARSDAGGSGLGLAIVERAARLHGGEFHLDGREGGGLVARLVLPNA